MRVGFSVLSTGRRLMASLNTCQVCSPAEDLQTSQGRYHLARRARKKKTLTWRVGTWNVRSMVGTDGSVEVASGREGQAR